MLIELNRFAYLTDCTRGILKIGTNSFQTIERPWITFPDGPGGTPFESCIPDAEYRLRAYTRPSGKKALILSNEEHGVFEQESDRPHAQGRYLILIHPGNTVDDVVGCIAPGLTGGDHFVSDSRKAMLKILELLEGFEHTIRIGPKRAV
jgi:hypothetical protein